MVLPLLALAGTALKLFGVGKEVYEAVTGKPATSGTPEEFQAELQTMTPEQVRLWETKMEMPLKEFEAETRRMVAEQGEVNASTLTAIPPAAAAKVAILRMTTRPWLVRLMARGLVYPIFLVIGVDFFMLLAANIASSWGGVFEPTFMAPTILEENFGFTTLYSWYAPTASSVIASYIGAREVGKWKRGEETTVSGTIAGAKDIVKAVGKLF